MRDKWIANEAIRRLTFYIQKCNMNIGDAMAHVLQDAEHLGELAQHQVVECLLPEIVVLFAEKYNSHCDTYNDDENEPDLQELFDTWKSFEGLSQDSANVVAITINEGAAALLHEEDDEDVDWEKSKLKDDDDDDDEDADENIVFSSAEDWKRLSPEARLEKVKAFLRKLAHAHRDIADNKSFVKSLTIGDQENPYGIKVGSNVKARTSHDPRTESISFPNSSGQGHDELHRAHPLRKTLVKHGYSYSHTTPVNQKNGVLHHHTWRNGPHQIGAYEGDTKWSSKVSPSSGHVWTGIGAKALDQHLQNKARRYKQQQVGENELAHGLLESGDQEVQGYLDYINRNPPSLLSSDFAGISPSQQLRETLTMRNRQAKLFGDGMPQTDSETRRLMNRENQ